MTRYSKTMSESLAEVYEGFSPKQIKMAIGIANDPRYKGGNYSGAVKQIEKIKKGLSSHKQVAAVLKRLNTDFDPEIKDDEEMTESSARRDAMRHGAGGRRGIDPADRDDVKATDKDKELAKKNMVMQLRKSKDTKGNFSIEFQDGKKQKVDPKVVDMLLKAHDMIQKPRDKEQFVQMISKSYRDMLKTTKMVSKQLRMGEEVFLEGFEVEEVEIDEMKMDDPKLVKVFDKLKKGQTIKLKTSSTISKGKDFVEYIVKSKNTVNKGRVEKVTLVTKGNEKSVKKFLYKRNGKVTFAIGDMGASIDDIKEQEEPQKSDGAKAVDQGREDKKKTRIASLQLQIAKAQETINKLNAQEK